MTKLNEEIRRRLAESNLSLDHFPGLPEAMEEAVDTIKKLGFVYFSSTTIYGKKVMDILKDLSHPKFEVGKTYYSRSLCDYECVYSFEVFKRTEKTITIDCHGRLRRRAIFERDGVECVRPFESYSMAPTLHANKSEKPE